MVRTADGKATQIYRGGQPQTCGELNYLRELGIRSILKLNERHTILDADEKIRATELGQNIRSFSFDANTIGTPPTCDAVREALAFLRHESNWPIFVHCTAGKDRTGYLIGLFEKVVLSKPTDSVLAELRRYGHKGVRAGVMEQIDTELAKEFPECVK